MADPRTFAVKQCTPSYAANSGAAIGAATSARKDFFNGLGKIGDLAVLNSIGGGKVGQGLRTLASISNTIRTGTGTLPASIGTSPDTGAHWVLNTTGIGAPLVDALRNFHPNIANQAFGQARTIFSDVKQGNFKLTDIPTYLQDFQNLAKLTSGIFTPSSSDVHSSLTERCDASPYAMDLIARAPKYKFLFVVQFIPDAPYQGLSGGNVGPLDMAFTVKKSTRPNVKFVMEDVNYYNFRTKVITKTEFEEMNMSFHDDTMNIATEFYNAYLRAMSPIAGLIPQHSDISEEGGMDFTGKTLVNKEVLSSIAASKYAASSGPLAGDVKQVFSEIRLYHLFDYGNRMTVYRFHNPRISHLAPDDLDMSVGTEGSELSLSFAYDAVYVDTDVKIDSSQYNIGQLQRGSTYPLRNNSGTSGPTAGGFNPYGSKANVATLVNSGANGLKTIDTSSANGSASVGSKIDPTGNAISTGLFSSVTKTIDTVRDNVATTLNTVDRNISSIGQNLSNSITNIASSSAITNLVSSKDSGSNYTGTTVIVSTSDSTGSDGSQVG